MTMNANELPSSGSGGDYNRPNVDAGTYPARILQVVNLGLQAQRPYKGEDRSPAMELLVTYELLDVFMQTDAGEDIEDKPLLVTERFKFSAMSNEKARSTKRYKAIDPANVFGGAWDKLVGLPVSLTLIINEKGEKQYLNVGGVSPMRPKDASKAGDLINPPIVFNFYKPDIEQFAKLPDWIKNIITSNLQFNGSELSHLLSKEEHQGAKAKTAAKPVEQDSQEELDDEIPF